MLTLTCGTPLEAGRLFVTMCPAGYVKMRS